MADLTSIYNAPISPQPAEISTPVATELGGNISAPNQFGMSSIPVNNIPSMTEPYTIQLKKLQLQGQVNPMLRGIVDGVASHANNKMNEAVLINEGVKGNTVDTTINRGVDEFAQNFNSINKSAEELQANDTMLKKLMQDNLDIQNRMKDAFSQSVSGQGILDAQQRIADLQAKAPVAPDLQSPELKAADQALIFLAGLIGGTQAVPQAIQGAIAGAKQRAEIANQMASKAFEQQQQVFNKQAGIEQALLQRETTKYNIDSTNLRNLQDNYTTINNQQQATIARLEGQQETRKKNQYTRLAQAYKGIVEKAYKEFAIDQNAVDAVEKIRQAALAIGENPDLFPAIEVGKTSKGVQFENTQALNNTKAKLQAMNTANTLVTQMIKPADYDKVITLQEAIALNNNIAMIASKTNVDRALLPTYQAGKSLESQVFGWRQDMDTFRKEMAQQALAISQANLKLAQDRETRLASQTGNDALIKMTDEVHKLEIEQSALAKIPAELATGDTKRKQIELAQKLKLKREDLYKMQIQLGAYEDKNQQDIDEAMRNLIQFGQGLSPSGTTLSPEYQQALGNVMGFSPADIASAQATAKEINKKQQTSGKGKQPPRMPGNVPSNPEPIPVDPNLIPKPAGASKPTAKSGDKATSSSGREGVFK